MFNIDTINADILKPDSRIFRRIYDYRIWVELDERLPVIKPMVTTRVITQKKCLNRPNLKDRRKDKCLTKDQMCI